MYPWHRSRFRFCVLFPSRGFGFSGKRGERGSTYHVGLTLRVRCRDPEESVGAGRVGARLRATGSRAAGDGANGVDPGIAARRTKARKGGRFVRGAGAGGWPGEPGAVRSTGRSGVIPARLTDGGVRPSEPGGEPSASEARGSDGERAEGRTRTANLSRSRSTRRVARPEHPHPIKGARPARSGSEARVCERDHPHCKVLRPPHCRGERPTRLAGNADR